MSALCSEFIILENPLKTVEIWFEGRGTIFFPLVGQQPKVKSGKRIRYGCMWNWIFFKCIQFFSERNSFLLTGLLCEIDITYSWDLNKSGGRSLFLGFLVQKVHNF